MGHRQKFRKGRYQSMKIPINDDKFWGKTIVEKELSK